jgi:hypothetical protein
MLIWHTNGHSETSTTSMLPEQPVLETPKAVSLAI